MSGSQTDFSEAGNEGGTAVSPSFDEVITASEVDGFFIAHF